MRAWNFENDRYKIIKGALLRVAVATISLLNKCLCPLLSFSMLPSPYVRRNTVGLVHSLHEVTTPVIFTVKICIFERSNEKSNFSKTKIYFHKKTTPKLLEHIGLQNMKVGEETNFGRLATIFQVCSMDADILS